MEPMPDIRAVIFDLDGTLLDTLGCLAGTMDETLRSLGFVGPSREAYPHLIGDGAQVLARRALPAWWQRDDATAEAVYQTYLAVYERRWRLDSPPFPGIAELLDACMARDVALAVFSNKADAFTQKLVHFALGGRPWRVVRGQRPEAPRKPAPDGALAVARDLGVEPAQCLFLGDSDVDMRCARAAGMFAVGAQWGFRSAEELLAHGAHHIAAQPADVVAWLE